MQLHQYIIAMAIAALIGCSERAQEGAQKSAFPAELVNDNLPIYLTYLRLNQNSPIKGVETMGGAGIVGTSTATTTCHLVLMLLVEEGKEAPLKLYYKINNESEEKIASLSLIPCDYGIVNARVDFEIPSTDSLSGYHIIISLDGENWYPYVFLQEGCLLELLRQSALPLPSDVQTNQNGTSIQRVSNSC